MSNFSKNTKQQPEAEHRGKRRLPHRATSVSEYLAQWQEEHGQPADLMTAMEELQTSYEELRVAEEELLQQNDALASMQIVLEGERARYLELFDLAPDGYIVTDVNGLIVEANRAAIAMLAIDERFVVGKPLVTFIPDEHRADFRTKLLRAAKTTRSEWDSWIKPRIGNSFPATFTVAPSDDRVLRWLVRDATERRQAEAALYEANQTLNTLVLAAPVAIAIFDLKNDITLWNPAAEKLFGWPASEVVGKNLYDVTLGGLGTVKEIIPDAEENAKICQEKIARGEAIEGVEGLRRHRTGKILNVELWTAPLRDAEGNHTSTVGVAVDISERKAVEASRRQLLERIVEVQEEERRRLSRELHDHLGQQLTALSLGLKALQSADESTTGEQPVQSMKASHLQELVGELMQTTHRLAWELRPAELDDIGLEAALRRYIEHWSANTGIDADFQCMGGLSRRMAECVETTFFRVTQESLTNISRHAGAKHVSVVLKCEENEATVIVEDDGCGFEVMAKSGRLGITGMRERLKLIGGSLEVESAHGQGTTIFARVPYPEAPRLEFVTKVAE